MIPAYTARVSSLTVQLLHCRVVPHTIDYKSWPFYLFVGGTVISVAAMVASQVPKSSDTAPASGRFNFSLLRGRSGALALFILLFFNLGALILSTRPLSRLTTGDGDRIAKTNASINITTNVEELKLRLEDFVYQVV